MSLRLNFEIIVAFVIKLLKSLNPNLQFSCDFLRTLLCLQCFWISKLYLDSLVFGPCFQVQPKLLAISTALQTVVTYKFNGENKIRNSKQDHAQFKEEVRVLLFKYFVRMFLQASCAICSSILSSIFLNYTQLGKFDNKNQCHGPYVK